MNVIVRKPWNVHQSLHTDEHVYRNRKLYRRQFLKTLGLGGLCVGLGSHLAGCSKPTDEEILQSGRVDVPEAARSVFQETDSGNTANTAEQTMQSVVRDKRFEYSRAETLKRHALEYTNFYEFSDGKDSWKLVEPFQPFPWKFKIDGLCSEPKTFDIDDVYRQFTFQERAYRHRCVETWAMCVPWIGFPLHELLKQVEPQPAAKYVAFETFNRPAEAPAIGDRPDYPWPYTEGLTIQEATNELAFVAVGMYGEPLPKQNGAPIRLVIPWKYGYKSIKSIARITLTDKRPDTFWSSLAPHEYPFESNVDPEVPHPRWSQRHEWMLNGVNDFGFHDRSLRFETQKYNGYGEYVAEMYA